MTSETMIGDSISAASLSAERLERMKISMFKDQSDGISLRFGSESNDTTAMIVHSQVEGFSPGWIDFSFGAYGILALSIDGKDGIVFRLGPEFGRKVRTADI